MKLLHDIKANHKKFKLTNDQIMAIGDGQIAGYDMRIWVGPNDTTKIQHVQWWGSGEDHIYNSFWHNARERRTRLRRGLEALKPGNQMPIYFTPAARRARGLA